MANRLAGNRYFRRRGSTRRRRLTVVSIGVVVVVAALVALHLGVFSMKKNKSASTNPTAIQQSFGGKQVEDVGLVAGAMGQYASANGALPTHLSVAAGNGLVLCGSTCDPTTNTVSGLSVYQALNIKIVPYSSGLTAPNTAAMYLVPEANCANNGAVGSVNTNPRSMVLLYDGENSENVATPHCIVL